MIPRLKPNLSWNELIAAWTPSKENEVTQFEKSFARLMDVKYAISFPYGRTGLTILLKALGLENREIICPAYTCVVVPHAVITSGNEPVFIDSQEYDFNMNLELAENAINSNTGAIISTSIFGYPINLDQLNQIKERNPNLYIIQDCAHSFEAEWKGKPVHKLGDAAIFGLNISKLMTSVFGGMVTTDRDDLAKKLYELRNHYILSPTWKKNWQRRIYITAIYPAFNSLIYGFVNKLEQIGMINRFIKYYDDNIIDMPKDYLIGLTDVEAKVGQIQIKKYKQIVERRRENVLLYNEQLQDIKDLILPPIIEGATYSHYVARVKNRNEIMSSLLEKGIQLGKLIEYCIPEMSVYRNRTGSRYQYDIAKQLSRETINLPIYLNNTRKMEKIINALRFYYRS